MAGYVRRRRLGFLECGRRRKGKGKAMIGNHLLDYRLMKEHQDLLLKEGQQLQELRSSGRKRRLSLRDRLRPSFLGPILGPILGRPKPGERPAPLPVVGMAMKRPARRQLPSLLSVERALMQRLSTDVCRRTRRLARTRAINRFARTHNLWYEALFDHRSVRSLPEEFYKRSPSALARSWAAQFPYFREVTRERDVERLEPVARDFLEILAEEEERLALKGVC